MLNESLATFIKKNEVLNYQNINKYVTVLSSLFEVSLLLCNTGYNLLCLTCLQQKHLSVSYKKIMTINNDYPGNKRTCLNKL